MTTDNSALNGTASEVIRSLVQKIYDVNKAPKASKVVDENEEPKLIHTGFEGL